MVRLEDHYEAVRARERYDPVDDLELGAMDAADVRRRFVAGEDGRAFAEGVGTDGICTFGVSVTGPPHAGTLGQMQTAIALQDVGFDVQFIVADMEPYSTDGYALDVVRERARRFVEFVDALGFDRDAGRLRTQYDAADVMHTAYHLSRYADPDRDRPDVDPTAWMEGLTAAYDDAGVDAAALGESDLPADWEPSAFTRRMDGFLMVADMLHPLVADDYDANCIVMGADELALKPMVEGVHERCGTDATLHALYTRLVGGLDGFPKLSRRIPDSRFTLADDPAAIRATVRDPDPPARGDGDPTDSVVFGMMQLASAKDTEQVEAWRRACEADGEAWDAARAEFAEELVTYANAWRATADENDRESAAAVLA